MKTEIVSYTTPVNDMTIEEYIINRARASNPENQLNHATAPKLMLYLIESKHWSPFETVFFGVEITTSRAIGTQLLRHRSFSFQEFSQRYAEVTEIELVELRMQADKNRQSSTDICNSTALINTMEHAIKTSKLSYDNLIKAGVAKECARMVLPLSTQTTLTMTGSLRSWIHFFDQRCDAHAQKEIQDIAYSIRSQMSEYTPWTAKALNWEN